MISTSTNIHLYHFSPTNFKIKFQKHTEHKYEYATPNRSSIYGPVWEALKLNCKGLVKDLLSGGNRICSKIFSI